MGRRGERAGPSYHAKNRPSANRPSRHHQFGDRCTHSPWLLTTGTRYVTPAGRYRAQKSECSPVERGVRLPPVSATCGTGNNAGMLVVDQKTQKSPFANLCAAPGRASRRNLNALIDRYQWLQQLPDPTTALQSIADLLSPAFI